MKSKYLLNEKTCINDFNCDFVKQIEFINILFDSIIENDSESIELKSLGKTLVDSIKLLHILKLNKNISRDYENLKVKLYLEINKYSKIRKICRTKKIYVPFYISNTGNKSDVVTDIFSCKGIYIIKEENSKFEINDILNSNNLSQILIESEKKYRIKKFKEFNFPYEIIELDRKIKNIFEIINNKELLDDEYLLLTKIIESSKKMYRLFFMNISLEQIINIDLNNLNFNSEISSLLSKFIIECENNYNKYCIEYKEIIKYINELIDEYEKCYSVGRIRDVKLPTSMVDKYNNLYKMYYEDKTFNNGFLSFLKIKYPNEKEIINYEEQKNQQAINLYSEYLVYKISNSNTDKMMSFDEFVKDKYGISNIKMNVRKS